MDAMQRRALDHPRGARVKFVQENYPIFSHEVFSIPRGIMAVKMVPLTVDPPLQDWYCAVLNPSQCVRKTRAEAEETTRRLIAELEPRCACEFVNNFACVMPVTIFPGHRRSAVGEVRALRRLGCHIHDVDGVGGEAWGTGQGDRLSEAGAGRALCAGRRRLLSRIALSRQSTPSRAGGVSGFPRRWKYDPHFGWIALY